MQHQFSDTQHDSNAAETLIWSDGLASIIAAVASTAKFTVKPE